MQKALPIGRRLDRLSTASASFGKNTRKAAVQDALGSPGRHLEPGLQRLFGTLLGYDFSRIRIHASEVAAESASALGASAYTVGSQLVFGRGACAPEHPRGGD